MKRRELKKDIDFLVGEVISDCYTTLVINGEKHREAIVEIMESVVNKRNELFEQVNMRLKTSNSKEVKQHFRAIQTDMLETVNSSFSKLSEVVKS